MPLTGESGKSRNRRTPKSHQDADLEKYALENDIEKFKTRADKYRGSGRIGDMLTTWANDTNADMAAQVHNKNYPPDRKR